MARRISVVLFNLGGPDDLKAVRPFLFNLFSDPAILTIPNPFRWILAQIISRVREKTAQTIYQQIGGASPLVAETELQRQALETRLQAIYGAGASVVVAMRYWRPFTRDAAKAVAASTPDEVVLLPLYPQFSTTTTGSSLAAWRHAYRGGGRERVVCCYPEADGFVQAYAVRIRETLRAGDHLDDFQLVFSAHGLPEKIIAAGDPYQNQVERTALALAAALGSTRWVVSYQSRVGPLKWIGPSTVEVLEQAGRDKRSVLVVPLAFVSEHSETLVELDIEYAELALHAGVPTYLRAPAVGVQEAFIAALADMVELALRSAEPLCAGSASCPLEFAKCPRRALGLSDRKPSAPVSVPVRASA